MQHNTHEMLQMVGFISHLYLWNFIFIFIFKIVLFSSFLLFGNFNNSQFVSLHLNCCTHKPMRISHFTTINIQSILYFQKKKETGRKRKQQRTSACHFNQNSGQLRVQLSCHLGCRKLFFDLHAGMHSEASLIKNLFMLSVKVLLKTVRA